MRYGRTVTGQAGTGNKYASVTGWSVPGYTGLKALGSGGFGDVVLARHDASGTTVAIKYMRREFLADPQWAGLFRAEAQVLAALDDPNIVRLYEYVECPSGAAIVMELVDGVSVRQILAHEGATTPEAALVVLLGSLLGLAGAHRRGIVHRDYKPENVLVNGSGVSKLTDFGIAVRTGDQPHAAGTIAYAAPEQMGGGPATPAADVYAATATFYECLTGRPPFTGETTERVMYQHLFEPVPLEPVPVPLRPLVEAGMAKEPERRPTDGTTFVAALRAVAGAYGPDWEERGRSHLGEAALLLAALWPAGAAPAVQGSAVQHVPLNQQRTKESAHLRHLWHLKHLRHLAHLRRLHPVRAALAIGAGAALAAAGLYAANLSFNNSAPPHPRPAITQSVPVSTTPPPPQTLSTGPAVGGLSPASGPAGGGTLVTITGTRLGGPVFVKFGARDGTIIVDLDTKIVVKSPPGHGTVEITVITPGGISQAGEFSYHPGTMHAKAPRVTRAFPATGPATGRTPVTITGTRLADASTVSFGGAAGTITSDSATKITVTSPPGHGTVDVAVTTPGGTTAAGAFSYSAPATHPTQSAHPASSPAHSTPPPPARPVISWITPHNGPMAGGTPVTITGSALTNASTVSFGGAAGTITSRSGTQLTVKSPPGRGTVTVTVTTPGGTATAGSFTYNPPPATPVPVIIWVSPRSGPETGGTPVTITGFDLANATGVSFGGAAGTIRSDSATQITVTSPPVASAGTVTITVTTKGGTSASSFTYLAPAPVISSVSPSSGPTGVGTPVTITGENLSGATVSFGGTGGSVSADTSTQITVTSPADTSAGPVDITVAAAGGTVSAGTYTYVAPPPTIASISPASATESTTITVYIYGTNLSGATSVSFGSEGSGTITSVSSTVIEVTAPEFCGTVNITVTTPAGTATSPDQFSEGCVYGVEVPAAG